ncbi:MAG: LacI family DNA-binding transcriptional regulator [Planctomycetota bacterium]
MASFRQIAQDAGVSIATVSRVLNANPNVNEDARRRVLEAANRVGYVRKVGKRSVAEGLALAYAGPVSVESPYDHGLLQGIGWAVDQTAGVDRFGHDLLVLSMQRSLRPGESPAELFLRKGIKGAIIRTTDEYIPLCEELAATGFPAVVVGERFDDPSSKVSFVDAESRGSSTEAVRYLIELGHERIAVVSNAHDDTDHLDRMNGWRDAHEQAGIVVDEDRVIRVWATLEAGVQVAKRMASLPKSSRPTAAYVADPMAALGMLRGLQEAGLNVPTDFSLIGFDDGNLRKLSYPMMTAVCQDVVQLGEKAVEIMRELIADRSVARTKGKDKPEPRRHCVTVQTTFEVGETTGPPAS